MQNPEFSLIRNICIWNVDISNLIADMYIMIEN